MYGTSTQPPVVKVTGWELRFRSVIVTAVLSPILIVGRSTPTLKCSGPSRGPTAPLQAVKTPAIATKPMASLISDNTQPDRPESRREATHPPNGSRLSCGRAEKRFIPQSTHAVSFKRWLGIRRLRSARGRFGTALDEIV